MESAKKLIKESRNSARVGDTYDRIGKKGKAGDGARMEFKSFDKFGIHT